jgi:hypothetical protein
VVYQRLIPMVSALLLGISPAVAADVHRFDFQKVITPGTPLELTVNNPHGKVVVTATEADELTIAAVKSITAETKEEAEFIADHIQISVSETEGHVIIEPRFQKTEDRPLTFWQKLFGRGEEPSLGSVDFTISLPPNGNLDISSADGDVDVTGLRGNVRVSGQAGNVTVRSILGNLDLSMTSGTISVQDIEGKTGIKAISTDIKFYSLTGDLDLRNSSGQVTGEYLNGDLTMVQVNGGVELKHIEGDVRIKTTSADVTLVQEFGALAVETESGDITITTELNSPKDFAIETVSGSIEFNVPEASGGEVQLEAGSGEIDTRIPIVIESFSRNRISGKFGDGGPKIILATVSGAITLAEF